MISQDLVVLRSLWLRRSKQVLLRISLTFELPSQHYGGQFYNQFHFCPGTSQLLSNTYNRAHTLSHIPALPNAPLLLWKVTIFVLTVYHSRVFQLAASI